MSQILSRLRAALTPAACFLLCIVALILMAMPERNGGSGETALEKRIGQALTAIEGVENVRVVIRTRKDEAGGRMLGTAVQYEEVPCGAVAVVSGAQDPLMRLAIAQALCALLGLQASCVEVLSMTGG